MVVADVPGQTQEGFSDILRNLEPALKQAPGFILVTGYPKDGSWQTLEVWESAEDATRFFAEVIRPNLPPGLKPKRTLHPLQSLITP